MCLQGELLDSMDKHVILVYCYMDTFAKLCNIAVVRLGGCWVLFLDEGICVG